MILANLTEFENTWIGQGMKFRQTFNRDTGRVIANGGADRLHQSIYVILSTAKGERFLLPDFGSNLHLRVFEQNDYILKDLIQLDIREALGKWEPRIEILSIDIDSGVGGNTLPVSINYKLKGTNITGNYVYPFKRNAQSLGGEIDYE